MESSAAGRKQFLLTVLVACLLVFAGCAGIGSDDSTASEVADDSTAPQERPDIFESTTETLDEKTTESLWQEISANEELTSDGERFLEQLQEIEQLGDSERDAVAASVAIQGVDEKKLDRVDDIRESSTTTQREILQYGLADTSGDGILDGEAKLFGLDTERQYPDIATATRTLSENGYDETDRSYLQAFTNLSEDEFAREQAVGLGLVERAVENGTVTAADADRIRDQSGDGLLDGTAERLDLNPAAQHPKVAALAEPLSKEGYDSVEVTYLQTAAGLSDNRTLWKQASYLGLLNESVSEQTVDNTTVESLHQTDSGMLDGFADVLGLHSETDNETVAGLAEKLASDEYRESDVAFLERVGTVTESAFQFEQARAFSLLTAPVENGTVSQTDREQLEDTAGDGLLDYVAIELGVDPANDQSTLVEFAEPLAQDGYTETEFAYLERIDELEQYRGHEYELWAQAEQLGLLYDAVEDGEITEQQLWELQNNASNRLLNGMEVEFGTDPELDDTSGDGYLDHLAWGPLRDLGLAVTPDEPDVYVEVDTVSGQPLPDDEQRETIQSTFESEPSDEIGSINVHFHECRTDRSSVTDVDEMSERIGDHRTTTGLGFHYLLINDETIEFEGTEAAGVAFLSTNDPSWMAVDGTIRDRATAEHEASTIAHELGHSLGILDDDFEGVDSSEYSADEYNSVMNYNHWTPVTFSTGEPFDDYERMAAQSFGSFHQDRSALEAMWENGTVDSDALCS